MLISLNQFSAVRSILRPRRYTTREQIEAYQNKQLRRVIAHAYEYVPYYRRLFDRHGITPAQVTTVGDLASLPITSRRDLQSLPEAEIVARGVRPETLILRPTSGSSGEPLVVRRTLSEERLLNSFRRRAMNEYGLRSGDKVAYVTLKRSANPRDHQLALKLFQAAGLHRRLVIDSRLPAPEIVNQLRHFGPSVIVGYAGALARIADAAGVEERQSIRPRFIVAAAEMLTTQMREQVEAGFGVPVYDMYGSHEFNLIAWQCQAARSFHTCDDAAIVEILKDDGRPAEAGARGEVVATGLHSFAMPFIRYRLGDIVTKGDEVCRCGQPFSTIESIQGRTYVSFTLADGRSIYSFELWSVIRAAASWIRVYQLTQEGLDQFVLRIVPQTKPGEGEVAALRETLRATLGLHVKLAVELVNEIPADASGKFRAFRPLVDSADEGRDEP